MPSRRIFVDTSVFGGCFETPFKEASHALTEEIRTHQTLGVVSEMIFAELNGAPLHVQQLVESLPKTVLELIPIDDEVVQLAMAYMLAGVVPKGSRSDAFHVAAATVAKVDLIVSWNFKHIVNVQRIKQFNGVNLLKGYSAIDIRSPAEVLLLDEQGD